MDHYLKYVRRLSQDIKVIAKHLGHINGAITTTNTRLHNLMEVLSDFIEKEDVESNNAQDHDAID